MAKVDKRSAVKELCTKGCGNSFYPAGRVYHEKFCTGPGYKSSGTHSSPGGHGKKKIQKRLDRAAKAVAKAMRAQVPDGRKGLLPCRKGCGRMCKAAGRPHHEKFCTGPGYVPGYSAQRRAERRISSPKPKVTMTKQTAAPAYTAYYAPISAVKMAYEMYPDDSALFSALTHIAASRVETDVEEQIKHLTQARDMLTLKIDSLSD